MILKLYRKKKRVFKPADISSFPFLNFFKGYPKMLYDAFKMVDFLIGFLGFFYLVAFGRNASYSP